MITVVNKTILTTYSWVYFVFIWTFKKKKNVNNIINISKTLKI
jgi:hypothetical protein